MNISLALRRKVCAATACLLTVSVLGAAPAAAAGNGQGAGDASADAQTALVEEYTSLSGALINLYATNSGMTLERYLASQQILLSPAPLADPVAGALADDAATGGTDTDPAAPTDLPADTAGGTQDASTAGDVDVPAPDAPDTSAFDALQIPTVPALGTAEALGSVASEATPVTASTVAGLNEQLAAAGLTIDTKAYDSLDALARGVVAKANTADGAVTLASTRWMTKLSKMRAPKLKSPKKVSANVPGLPKNALVFGLFADKSLTQMLSSNPGLFAAASKSGLGSKKMTEAWNKSMLEVYNSSQADFSKVLPDPCTGGMLAVMASGDAGAAAKVGGSGCGTSCVTGGLYLHNQTTSLFSPAAASTKGNPFSSVWNSTTLEGMQRWQQKELLAQNPQLTNQLLADTKPQDSASCTASSKAAKNTLGSTLPGIFGQLRTNK